MEKINVSEAKVLDFAKKGLIDIGYPENIEVTSYIGDDSSVIYWANYCVEGLDEKHLKPLRVSDIVMLVQHAMVMEGYDAPELTIRVRNDKVCYSVLTNIATYDNKGINRKRG